jgi:hypothetical protein
MHVERHRKNVHSLASDVGLTSGLALLSVPYGPNRTVSQILSQGTKLLLSSLVLLHLPMWLVVICGILQTACAATVRSFVQRHALFPCQWSRACFVTSLVLQHTHGFAHPQQPPASHPNLRTERNTGYRLCTVRFQCHFPLSPTLQHSDNPPTTTTSCVLSSYLTSTSHLPRISIPSGEHTGVGRCSRDR